MSSTTTYKGIQVATVGGDSGTWGGVQASGFTTIDNALGGISSVSISSTNVTLNATQSGSAILRLTGQLGSAVQITTACQGFQFIENKTTYVILDYLVTVTNGVGSPVTIPRGAVTPIVCDATNGCRLAASLSSAVGDFSVPGNLTVTGTSATTGAASFSAQAVLTEIATPAAPSSGKVQLYGYSGDYLASQTPAGVQRIYGKDPTVQKFTAGSGTYAPTPGAVRIRVRMVGPSGAGGGQSDGNAASGNTTFGTWTAIAGAQGLSSGAGGAGGSGGADGTGTSILRVAGGKGGMGGVTYSSTNLFGGAGGVSALGGAGGSVYGISTTLAGSAPSANSGSGAGGGIRIQGGISAGGSGAGEYVEFYVISPSATSYSVGIGGTSSGTASTAGSNGGIWIEEFYS